MDSAPPANAFIAALAKNQESGLIEVWPENWQAFDLFCQLRTQWNVAMGGPTGLRYESVYPLLTRSTADDDEWWQLFADLQVMEFAALEQMQKGDD